MAQELGGRRISCYGEDEESINGEGEDVSSARTGDILWMDSTPLLRVPQWRSSLGLLDSREVLDH